MKKLTIGNVTIKVKKDATVKEIAEKFNNRFKKLNLPFIATVK